jgi:hypothetical protein
VSVLRKPSGDSIMDEGDWQRRKGNEDEINFESVLRASGVGYDVYQRASVCYSSRL